MANIESVTIVVAAHKPYWMPQDSMYVPVQVGAIGNESMPGFQRDDSGANISEKNPRYCELTALYWAWKNVEADYIGLAHYRRHFAGDGENGIATLSDVAAKLVHAPVVLPRKRYYGIETIESHYGHTFDAAHLAIAREAIGSRSPEILPAFDAHMEKRSAHIWNMAIMRRDVLDQWCSWLFPILDEIDSAIDYRGMTPFESRVVGRLSERLLDPWLDYTGWGRGELPVKSLEKTNWVQKGGSFLKAKFIGKKYTESF